MKRLLLIVIFALLLGACQPGITLTPLPIAQTMSAPIGEEAVEAEEAPAPPRSTMPPILFTTLWEDRSPYIQELVESAQPILQELPDASVYHIELNVEDDLAHLNGRLEVNYTNAEKTSLNEIYFRLFPNIFGGKLQVNDLTVEGEPIEGKLEQGDSALRVPLAEPLVPGGSVVISMQFILEVPASGNSNYNTFAYTDDVLALAQFYPMIPAYDDQGWYTEIPSQMGDVTYVDAAFFLVRITAPRDLVIGTSGTTIGKKKLDEKQRLVISAGPIRDFYMAASKNYQVQQKKVGQITVNSYAAADVAESSAIGLDVAAKAIEVFSEHFSPYPYSEFDIVSTPTQAYGVEYPGMTAIARRLYTSEDTGDPAQTRIYFESTIAHEVAHQWFYNMVGDDQVHAPWLDEALAQYATGIYFQDKYGSQAASQYRQSWEGRWAQVNFAEIPIGKPVSAYSENEYGPIVYGRGPIFLETLAKQMGEDVFSAFLKEYSNQYQWKIATPAEFQQMAEDQCGCDLNPLFKQWVFEN